MSVCKRCLIVCKKNNLLISHLQKREPCKISGENIDRSILINEIKNIKVEYNCKYCNQVFDIYRCKYNHEKYYCHRMPLNTFGNETIDYIIQDNSFLEKCCLNITNGGIINLVEKIFYNQNYPKNRNIRIKSTKNKLCEYYNNDWIIIDKNSLLDNIISKCYKILYTYFKANLQEKDSDDYLLSQFINILSKYKNVYYPLRTKIYALMISKHK
jgi:hypothetical protein